MIPLPRCPSRPVDALPHAGEAEAVAERGARSLRDTFTRLLPVELERGKSRPADANR